jgi:hypothetical protein
MSRVSLEAIPSPEEPSHRGSRVGGELDVPTMKRMRYAERIRAQLGLRYDLAYIQELAEQKDLDTTEIGTPVTHEEFADLQARRVLGGYLPAVEAQLRDAPNYAGRRQASQTGDFWSFSQRTAQRGRGYGAQRA